MTSQCRVNCTVCFPVICHDCRGLGFHEYVKVTPPNRNGGYRSSVDPVRTQCRSCQGRGKRVDVNDQFAHQASLNPQGPPVLMSGQHIYFRRRVL